jgi:hypothetical protein
MNYLLTTIWVSEYENGKESAEIRDKGFHCKPRHYTIHPNEYDRDENGKCVLDSVYFVIICVGIQ